MTANDDPQVFDVTGALADELVTHKNVKQELVITTVDKLKLCLIDHKEYLRSRREWIGSLGLLVALLATLVAADFKSVLGLDAATWEALFLLSAILTGAVTILLVVRAIRTLKEGGIDSLIDKIADRSEGGVRDDLYATILTDLLKGDTLVSDGEPASGPS